MKKLTTADIEILGQIAETANRNQFEYHEYTEFRMDQLKKTFIHQVSNTLENPETEGYVLIEKDILLGLIIGKKDAFDSEQYGFLCYRISDLLVFPDNDHDVSEIIKKLISELEASLVRKSRPVYIRYWLNNNTGNMDRIFNGLVSCNYYYTQSLLMYTSLRKKYDVQDFYPKEQLHIRLARESDVEQVASLAERSFQYTRFHMDPFLPKQKAGELFRIAAENSILHHFADVMFIAETENKIVGFFGATKTHFEYLGKTFGDGLSAAVDEEFRGKGIMTKLDNHLQTWYYDHVDIAENGMYLINTAPNRVYIAKGFPLIRGMHHLSKKII